jgi:hypothetical protein
VFRKLRSVDPCFFAALIGFGLKHILDANPSAYGDIVVHRWQYFLVSVFLFLRFFLGSLITFGLSILSYKSQKESPASRTNCCFLIFVS